MGWTGSCWRRCRKRRAVKKASTDTGLSNVGISYDQSSRWQKLAAVPEEIFVRGVQDKTHMPTTTGLIRAGAEPKQRPAADGRGCTGAPNGAIPRHAPFRQTTPLLMADRTRDAAWIAAVVESLLEANPSLCPRLTRCSATVPRKPI
jgi:hypothetical protein